MSSIIAHLSAGIGVYLCRHRLNTPETRFVLPLLVLTAIVPDFDYLAFWLLGINTEPRLTHTLIFCIGWAVLVKILINLYYTPTSKRLSLWELLAAGSSHLLLDLLVNVHPVPILWPLPIQVALPIGILPSAGQLRLSNYFLWRNLLIEITIVLPLIAGIVAIARASPWPVVCKKAIFIFPIWIISLIYSLSLSR
jgi:inner membrane protein